jgi:hypothetical protein
MATKSTRAKLSDNPYRTTASPDDLAPPDRIAFELIAERRDLLPSVDRIMSADLPEDARLRAMTLFRDSLGHIGDPHRDPSVAIANSRLTLAEPASAPRST